MQCIYGSPTCWCTHPLQFHALLFTGASAALYSCVLHLLLHTQTHTNSSQTKKSSVPLTNCVENLAPRLPRQPRPARALHQMTVIARELNPCLVMCCRTGAVAGLHGSHAYTTPAWIWIIYQSSSSLRSQQELGCTTCGAGQRGAAQPQHHSCHIMATTSHLTAAISRLQHDSCAAQLPERCHLVHQRSPYCGALTVLHFASPLAAASCISAPKHTDELELTTRPQLHSTHRRHRGQPLHVLS